MLDGSLAGAIYKFLKMRFAHCRHKHVADFALSRTLAVVSPPRLDIDQHRQHAVALVGAGALQGGTSASPPVMRGMLTVMAVMHRRSAASMRSTMAPYFE